GAGSAAPPAASATPPASAAPATIAWELQAGGRIAIPLAPGVTRVEAFDGSIGAAWVHALDTPYYALTDDRGRFRIDHLAAGTYEVTIWQAPAPVLVRGALTYKAPVIVKRTVRVDATRAARLDLALGR
nr:carboxypeptidase-like regulatory domain-containing protein [Myxococcota bacterium]